MFQLNNLTRLIKKRKKVGRGGSRGGTSGRGSKGQKARTSGNVPARFEGGQMTLVRRLPKRGFNNERFAKQYEIINIEQLDNSFNEGDLITKDLLIQKGIIKGKANTLLKVLGGYKVSKKLNIIADAFSKSAFETINNVGGKAQLTKES